jgi:hypothetical protein
MKWALSAALILVAAGWLGEYGRRIRAERYLAYALDECGRKAFDVVPVAWSGR